MKRFFAALRSLLPWQSRSRSAATRQHRTPAHKRPGLEALEDRTLPSVTSPVIPLAQPQTAYTQQRMASPLGNEINQAAQTVAGYILNGAMTVTDAKLLNAQVGTIASALFPAGSAPLNVSIPVTVIPGPGVLEPNIALVVLTPSQAVSNVTGAGQRVVLDVGLDPVINQLVTLGQFGESYLPELTQTVEKLYSVATTATSKYAPNVEPLLEQIYQNLGTYYAKGLQIAQLHSEEIAVTGLSLYVHVGGPVAMDLYVNIAPGALLGPLWKLGLIPDQFIDSYYESLNAESLYLENLYEEYLAWLQSLALEQSALQSLLAWENAVIGAANELATSKTILLESAPISTTNFLSAIPRITGGGGGGKPPSLLSGGYDDTNSPYKTKRVIADPYQFDQSPAPIPKIDEDDNSGGDTNTWDGNIDQLDEIARLLTLPEQSMDTADPMRGPEVLPREQAPLDRVLAGGPYAPIPLPVAQMEQGPMRLDRKQEEDGDASAAVWAALAWPIPHKLQQTFAGRRQAASRPRDRKVLPRP